MTRKVRELQTAVSLAKPDAISAVASAGRERRASAFGVYRGYSPGAYDGYRRESFHVSLAGGRRIAVDLLRPTMGGLVEQKPLPVLFSHTIYGRAATIVRNGTVVDSPFLNLGRTRRIALKLMSLFSGGNVVADQARQSPWIRTMLRHGYVVVAADAGGTGASFGAAHPDVEAFGTEGYALIDWIAKQDWCDGAIGLHGQSFVAMTAYAAAARRHPAVKAMLVSSPPFDSYRDVGYPGGIFAKGFGDPYVTIVSGLDRIATPVDADRDGSLLDQAMRERDGARIADYIRDVTLSAPFCDSTSAAFGLHWQGFATAHLAPKLRNTIPVYNIGGWRDIFVRSTLLWHLNLGTGAHRLAVRPSHHATLMQPAPDLDLSIEALRWFDRWLKGIDNGIDREPPVHLFAAG